MSRILTIPSSLNEIEKTIDLVDGFIIGIKDMSVNTNFCIDIEELDLLNKLKDKDIFISLNKNMHNKDLQIVKEILIKLNNYNIKGVLYYDVGILNILEVSEPQIWKYNGEDLTVCNNNYEWLTIMPQNDYYCITVMMNEKQEVQVCYIDMIAEQGYDEDGVPFFYDLYLDLVVYPDGTIIEDDMDELQDALENGDITQQQFDLALATKDKLKNGILSDCIAFKEYIQKMYDIAK